MKKELKDPEIISAILECASNPSCVQVTLRARQDMARLRISKLGALQAVCDWIYGSKPLIMDITKTAPHTGKPIFILYPEINGVARYVKLSLQGDSQAGFSMVIVSAHEKD